jgi:hypothetical protein
MPPEWLVWVTFGIAVAVWLAWLWRPWRWWRKRKDSNGVPSRELEKSSSSDERAQRWRTGHPYEWEPPPETKERSDDDSIE